MSMFIVNILRSMATQNAFSVEFHFSDGFVLKVLLQ